MLWIGLTGGIGAGKSAVSRELARHGAVVVDADEVAREVVEPGTPGLDAVVATFGPHMLRPDGSLDRERLGRLVFGNSGARRALSGIVHPLVASRTAELAAEAEQRGARVLVHDVPLLAENELDAAYHLVVVVEAPIEDRLHRLTALRGMVRADAEARIAAQATDEQRRAVADAVVRNDTDLSGLRERVDALWRDRVQPYADNLAAGRPAERGPAQPSPPEPSSEAAGRRLVRRLRFVCGPRAVDVRHVGSTANPGVDARDVIDLMVEVASPADADALSPVLAAAGFPHADRVDGGPDGEPADPARGQLHQSADPGRPADVRVQVAGASRARAAGGLRAAFRRGSATRVD